MVIAIVDTGDADPPGLERCSVGFAALDSEKVAAHLSSAGGGKNGIRVREISL